MNIKQEFRDFLNEVKDENIVIKGSYKPMNLIAFDEFDIADENGRTERKGDIKSYERENFEKQYGLELPKKKSEFPFIAEYQNTNVHKLINPIKVKIIDETDTGYFVKYTGIKPACVMYWEGNEHISFLVNKNKIEEFKKINNDNDRELSLLYKIAQEK